MSLSSTYSLVATKTEFQANSFEAGNQLLPDVTGLSNGGFAVAYATALGAPLIEFYDAGHQLIGQYHVPFEGTVATVGQPQVIELANGNVLVTWKNDEGVDAVEGRLFTAAGDPIGGEIELGLPVTGADADIQIAALENGGFVVTHTLLGNIYQTRHTNEGVQIGNSSQVNAGIAGDQADSAVAALSTGGYVVTYTDTDPADQTIRARVYNADGTTAVNDFIIDSIGDNTQSKVVGLADGKWAVVYTDTGWGGLDGGNSGITLQIRDGNGTNITPGGYIHVNTPSSNVEGEPDITVLENGFIVVTWTKQFVTDSDIKARVYTPEGVAVTDEFFLTLSGDDDVKSAVSGLLSGQFVTAWQDETTDGSGGQITAQVTEIVRNTTGDGSNDIFNGDELRDIVNGGGGNDTLYGHGGNDTLNGEAGADAMFGGAGDDIFIVAAAGDTTAENVDEGIDTARSYIDWVLADNVERLELQGSSNLSGTGNTLNNTLVGNAGNNLLNGGAGNDYMVGGAGNDTFIVAAAGDSTIEAAAGGTDTVRSYVNWTLGANVERLELQGSSNLNGTGNSLNNTLVGNSGNNSLKGGDGNDYIVGGAGNDTLTGGVGNDTLIGGAGSDSLNGGAGNDRFDFDLVSHSPAGPALRDSIVGGFSHGSDLIDLATIDANTLAGGNQAFSFIGSAAFSGVAGQLRYSNYNGNVVIDADVNGDSTADMQILVAGTNFMTGTDFIL
jgi:Ca2+-binding RTX toxin-like protein